MQCRDCGRNFQPFHGKPGFINQCEECATDVPLIGGNMIWEHKTAPGIEIKPLVEAQVFARAQRRSSASSPLRSIVQGREAPRFNPGLKGGSGAQPYAAYTSHLGEKRMVKP